MLVVAGAPIVEKEAASTQDAAKLVAEYMARGMRRKDAAKQVAQELNLPKNVVYDASLEME